MYRYNIGAAIFAALSGMARSVAAIPAHTAGYHRKFRGSSTRENGECWLEPTLRGYRTRWDKPVKREQSAQEKARRIRQMRRRVCIDPIAIANFHNSI